MKPKINFITLAVNDLEESIAFYSRVFNFRISEQSEDLCLFELEDDFYLAIQNSASFSVQTANKQVGVLSAGFILSHTASSLEEVDALVRTAEQFGCKKTKMLDEDWGYSVTVRDINGHHWEMVFFRDAH